MFGFRFQMTGDTLSNTVSLDVAHLFQKKVIIKIIIFRGKENEEPHFDANYPG